MSEKTINKIPNVPNLRFENDNSEWKLIKIKTLLKFQNGLNESQEKYGKGTKYISVSDILNNDYIMYDCIKGFVDINIDTFNNFIVEYGDILFQRSSETIENIGRSNVYLDKVNKSVFGGFIIRGKKIGEYDPIFFKHLLDTPTARKIIIKMGAGAQHYNISQDGLEKISLYFPTLEIQNKIGIVLSKMDLLISTQNKIIEDLIIKKKIISDKLFSQIPMHRNTLSSFYEKGRAGGTPKSTNKKYYAGEIPFLSISDMTEQGKYIYWTQKTLTQEGLENSTAWIVPKDSLVLSMYASVGQVAINKIPLTTSQAIFSMTITDKVILDFLYYYLSYFKEKKLHRYLETGTQSNINADFIKGIAIPDYGYYKNKLIISLLSLMDEKIKKEKDILSLYKKQKSYLLQNMFI